MSGRIRTIKPEWLEDELLAAEADHVRLLSIGLILIADDHGRGRASVEFVASEVWRYDRSPEALTKVREGLKRLSAVRFVRLYKVDGQSYFEIRSWSKHQKVQHVGKERVPAPPIGKPSDVTDEGTTPEGFTNIPETLTKPPDGFTPDLRPHTSDHDHGTTVRPSPKARGSQAQKGTRAPASDDSAATLWLERNKIPALSSSDGSAVAEFLDYWTGVPGSKGCKTNWLATWRNSVRMKSDRRGGEPIGAPRSTAPLFDKAHRQTARDRIVAEAERELEAMKAEAP